MSRIEEISRAPLPEALYPPAFCAVAGGRLHVVAVTPAGTGSLHLAIDADGATEPLAALPLQVGGIAADGEDLFLTGFDHDRRAVLLTVGGDGAVRGSAEIPLDGAPVLFPRPLRDPRGVRLVALTDPMAPRLWHARVAGSAIGEPAVVPLPGPTVEADVAALAGGIACARVLDRPSRLEVSLVGDDGGVTSVDVELDSPLSPALAAVPGGLLLLALSRAPGSAELFGLDERAQPRGGGRRLAAVAPATPRVGGLVADGQRVAVTWRSVTTGGVTASGELAEDQRAAVAVVDALGEPVAGPATVEPVGPLREAGGWLGDRLVLLHGGDVPVASVYRMV